tara:strand:+ start:422 stop:784 length:363 start_codon:yes stop_codon:yes gene_type:complete
MSSIYYAYLNEDSICKGITQYEQALDNPPSNYKEVDSFDESLLDKKWNGSSWEEVAVIVPDETAESARAWRDVELAMTDILVLLPDHPNAANLLIYRVALRDWPADAENFPDTKPELGEE